MTKMPPIDFWCELISVIMTTGLTKAIKSPSHRIFRHAGVAPRLRMRWVSSPSPSLEAPVTGGGEGIGGKLGSASFVSLFYASQSTEGRFQGNRGQEFTFRLQAPLKGKRELPGRRRFPGALAGKPP
jgi:hypothetical protein